mmetsp:Transcript_15071/g.24522  ORF Transcript_15071/g.24522 Transcript_15071/m.24522 type:complete len:466 (+) Transcript_15071:305-1702(+)
MEKRLRMAESQMCVDNEGLANDIMELHNDQHETWKDTRAIKSALKYHRNLTRNQNNWVNPVPRVPSSYWISNGYDDNEVEDMKALVRNIRDETRHMRVDGDDGRIVLRVPTADQLIIPHDAAFLLYWKEFADALDEYGYYINQSSRLDNIHTELHISGIQLPTQVLELLEDALEYNCFKEICLECNGGGRDIISFVRKVLEGNMYLEQLCLMGNPIESDHDFNELVNAISDHSSLKQLGLPSSCRDLDYNTLISIFSQCEQLISIDLSQNNIVTMGNTFLGNFLGTNSTLQLLALRGNNLIDFDAKSIARALATNNTLCYLDVRDNNLTDIGRGELLNAVFNSKSLNTVADSNCGSEWTAKFNTFHMRPNRRQKLYYVLSSRNNASSNIVQIGDDLALGHIPTLLDSVQKYSEVDYNSGNGYYVQKKFDVVPPLSVVYEILRGWNMPVLYENAHLAGTKCWFPLD